MSTAGIYEFAVTVVGLRASHATKAPWGCSKTQWTVEWKRGSKKKQEKRGVIVAETRPDPTSSELPLGTTIRFQSELMRGSKGGFRTKDLRLRFWKHIGGEKHTTGIREYKCSVNLSRCFPPHNKTSPLVQMEGSNVMVQLHIYAVLRQEVMRGCLGSKSLLSLNGKGVAVGLSPAAEVEVEGDSAGQRRDAGDMEVDPDEDSLSLSEDSERVRDIPDDPLPYPVGTQLRFNRRQGSFTPAESGHFCSLEADSPVAVFVAGKGECDGTVKCRIPAQDHTETASGLCVRIPEFVADCNTAYLVLDRGNPLDDLQPDARGGRRVEACGEKSSPAPKVKFVPASSNGGEVIPEMKLDDFLAQPPNGPTVRPPSPLAPSAQCAVVASEDPGPSPKKPLRRRLSRLLAAVVSRTPA